MGRLERGLLAALLVIQGLALTACASKPVAPVDRSRTSVILLPDDDGHVGAVVVSSPHGDRRIAAAYGMTTIAADATTAPEVTRTSAAAVQGVYGAVLEAQPTPPASFTLYFELGKARLTPASQRELPRLFEAVNARKPTEISIYGHSDSIGSDRRNYRLSELRAKAIERLLREHDSSLEAIDVKFLGDREPLFPTPDNVPEPRNRRAEVVVL
ncbi:MAG: OmpA family protein [Gammaproteobacteria bacterium]